MAHTSRSAQTTRNSEHLSLDAEIVYCTTICCTLAGIVLLIAGLMVYDSNAKNGGPICSCPDEYSGDECCTEVHSLCDECWCVQSDDSDGQCSDFEDTSSHGGAGLSLAIAGLVVCVMSAAMLMTMRWCKNWAEKNMHVKYPPVEPLSRVDSA